MFCNLMVLSSLRNDKNLLLGVVEGVRRSCNHFDVELFAHCNYILVPDSPKRFWVLFER